MPPALTRSLKIAQAVGPWLVSLILAYFALSTRVTVAETRQEELLKLPDKVEAVEGRVSTIENRLSATEANQRQILEMLREMRGDIKELIREGK